MRLMIALLAGVVISLPSFAAQRKKAATPKPAAHKKVKSKFEVKFLTFSQLSALPKAKRMEYVRDIAKLIVMMERTNSRFEVADNGMSLEDLKYKFAIMQQWLAILPEAEAREYTRTRQAEGNGVLSYSGGNYHCGTGYEVDLSIPGCLKVNEDGTTMFSSLDLRRGKCSGQQIPHPDPNSVSENMVYKGCMTSAGFGMLSSERREAVLASTPDRDAFLDPNAFLRSTRESQMQMAYGGHNGQPPGASDEADNVAPAGTPAAAAPAPGMSNAQVEEAINNAVRPPAPAAAVAEAAPAPAAAPAAEPAAAAAPAPAAVAAPAPAVVAPAPAAPAPAAAAAPAAEDPKADACIPEATSCEGIDLNSDATKKAISLFRKAAKWKTSDGTEISSNICISGGFPAKYTTGSKIAGTCRGPQKWGPANCKAEEVVCNPVLFCHTAKNPAGEDQPQWFCVEKKKAEGGGNNPQYTAACAAEYKLRLSKENQYSFAVPTGKKDKDGKDIKVSKKTDAQMAQACDPTKINVGGFQNEWDNMVAALKQLSDEWCGKHDAFKALFCRECQIVTNHIYAMNKKATGSGCAVVKPGGAPAETDEDKDEEESPAEGKK